MGSRQATGVGAAADEIEGGSKSPELGRALHYFLIVAAVIAVVWSIDAHFVTRSEFNELREIVTAGRKEARDDLRETTAQLRSDIWRAVAARRAPDPAAPP